MFEETGALYELVLVVLLVRVNSVEFQEVFFSVIHPIHQGLRSEDLLKA